MSDVVERHADQVAYWNGPGAEHWVAQQAHTDAMLAPIGEAILEHAAPQPGERVLDIGCGCGGTTLALASRVGEAGHVTGLDVSAPMLAVGRQRGAGRRNIDWIDADASLYRAAQPFDLLFSRFGVMFFGDPTAAFANLRSSIRPGGRLEFVCWRPIAENPWMQVPLHAAYGAGIPRLPKPGPEDPGPFAFADPERVTRILIASGWAAPKFAKLDLLLDIAAGSGLDGAVAQATQIGAASRALREAPEDSRPAAVAAIRAALAPFADGAHVRLPAAVWLVTSGKN
jgi:SAM-dependent methyltransferase